MSTCGGWTHPRFRIRRSRVLTAAAFLGSWAGGDALADDIPACDSEAALSEWVRGCVRTAGYDDREAAISLRGFPDEIDATVTLRRGASRGDLQDLLYEDMSCEAFVAQFRRDIDANAAPRPAFEVGWTVVLAAEGGRARAARCLDPLDRSACPVIERWSFHSALAAHAAAEVGRVIRGRAGLDVGVTPGRVRDVGVNASLSVGGRVGLVARLAQVGEPTPSGRRTSFEVSVDGLLGAWLSLDCAGRAEGAGPACAAPRLGGAVGLWWRHRSGAQVGLEIAALQPVEHYGAGATGPVRVDLDAWWARIGVGWADRRAAARRR